MDANEITKVIDGVYKNILENFNPASRQMISTGKAYLKSLHGASAASSLYLDTLVRLSRQAQQSTLGNSNDIGTSLIQITEVFKEIHAQHLNTLKAFYVDFLVPLESNLEKDTRVIQTEQKKFLMCHKQRMESYNKAATVVKKYRKKSKKNSSAQTLDKEIKVMQNLEEERSKLEAFCDKSIKDALTQERRRYGFILERQASLAKHYLAFYTKGNSLLNVKVENWMKTAKSREILPESMQHALLKRIQGGDEEECIYCSPRGRPSACGNSADDTASISSQLRKTKSMDAGEIINLQSEQSELQVTSGAGTMSRAKSDLNLMTNGNNTGNGNGNGFSHDTHDGAGNQNQNQNQVHERVATRPKSLAVATETTNNGYAKALYAYLSSGENQLSFLEGDVIAMIGDRNKGWQFGENLRTQKTGWFPIAYTEMDISTPAMDMMMKSATMPASGSSSSGLGSGSGSSSSGNNAQLSMSMSKMDGSSGSPIPPPMPANVPLPPSVISMNNINSQQSNNNKGLMHTMHGHGHGHGHGHHPHAHQQVHGTYSPTSSSNSSSSTFHQKRLNLADVIVHRTPEQMLSSHPTTPSAISSNNKSSVTSPITPTGNNLIVPSAGGQGQRSNNNQRSNNQGGSTPGCPSDSLHSSNDSGFSNDLNSITNAGVVTNRTVGVGGAVPPPQPDIDYSDDEPQQMSNRRKEKLGPLEKTPLPQTGDKWLMDRYHMSESIRVGGLGIGGITRRRSLSFSNVSGVGVGSHMRTNPRAPSHERERSRDRNNVGVNGNGFSPYPNSRHPGLPLNNNGSGNGNGMLGTPNYRRRDHSNEDSGSGLKKFLNRTKSLIWKRDRTDHLDTISQAGSRESLELWGSHNSLIEANYEVFEMKPMSSASIKAPSSHLYDDNDTIKDENLQDDDDDIDDADDVTVQDEEQDLKKMSDRQKAHSQQQQQKQQSKSVPPPLPPFPANLRGMNGFNVKKSNSTASSFNNNRNNNTAHKVNKATSTTQSLKSDSPPPIIPHINNGINSIMDNDNDNDNVTIHGRDNESCIFISDHMKHKGSQRSTRKSTKSTKSSTKSSNTNMNGASTRKSTKSINSKIYNGDHDYDDNVNDNDDQEDLSLSVSMKKGHVSRVESFTEFEAPIIPIAHKKKGTKSSNTNGNGAGKQMSNGINSTSNGNGNSNARNDKKLKNKNNVTKMGLNAANHSNHNNMHHNNSQNNSHSQSQSQISVSRSYIVEKTRKFSYNSEDEDEVPVDVDVDEYDVDEDVIDFEDDEEEENDVDNNSSVFMEVERDLDSEHDVDGEEDEDLSLSHSMSISTVDTRGQGQTHTSLPPSMVHHSSGKSTVPTSNGHHHHQTNGKGPSQGQGRHMSYTNGHHNSAMNGHGMVNSKESKSLSKNSAMDIKNNNHHINGENHYNHASRFAPILPYNGNVNGHVNGHSKGRMNSPAPPPPPPHQSIPNKSTSRHNSSSGDKARNGNGAKRSMSSGHRSGSSRPATIKGSIRSEFHTVELIATTDGGPGSGSGRNGLGDVMNKVPANSINYADQIHRRLYFPERNSRLDQKSERSGHRYGPWYDLWEADQSVPCK